jgi:hypothetical protein
MSYTSGVSWNVTVLDGKTITWISNETIASVLDPESTEPARRILRDGTVQDLDDDTPGLTVYGTHAWDRPTFDQFREIAGPHYAPLIEGIQQRRGTTHQRVTNVPRHPS